MRIAHGPNRLTARIETQDDIARLVVSSEERVLLERSLARADTLNFGYEGCSVQYLAWHAGRIVVVSSENSFCWLWSLGLDGSEEGMGLLPRGWRIVGDLVAFTNDYPGLVFLAELPSLRVLPPLTVRGEPRRDLSISAMGDTSLTVESDRLTLPSAMQREQCDPPADLPRLVEQKLFTTGAARAARLVIESATYPFMHRDRKSWQPPPVWITLYWYRHMCEQGREQEMAELLATLKHLSGTLSDREPEQGWRPEWDGRQGQVELAARYVCRHARTLLTACREGTLPPRWYCLLFEPAPGSDVPGGRVDATRYAPVLREVFDELARTRPKQFKMRW